MKINCQISPTKSMHVPGFIDLIDYGIETRAADCRSRGVLCCACGRIVCTVRSRSRRCVLCTTALPSDNDSLARTPVSVRFARADFYDVHQGWHVVRPLHRIRREPCQVLGPACRVRYFGVVQTRPIELWAFLTMVSYHKEMAMAA